MRNKRNRDTSEEPGVSILEIVVIALLGLYVVIGLGVFFKHHVWDALSEEGKHQVMRSMMQLQ